jgi:transcriptional regulator with XRE-family HTH domain
MPKNLLRHERRLNGAAVLAFRLAKQMTQAEVVTQAGPDDREKYISEGTLSRIERGGYQPSLDLSCRLANGLRVPLDAITYVVDVYVVDDTIRPVGTVVDANGNAA